MAENNTVNSNQENEKIPARDVKIDVRTYPPHRCPVAVFCRGNPFAVKIPNAEYGVIFSNVMQAHQRLWLARALMQIACVVQVIYVAHI